MWFLLACAAPVEDSAAPSESTQDTAPSQTPTPPNTSTPVSVLVARVGEATADGAFVGTESLRAIDDEGDGETLCDVTHTWTSVGTRDDCSACLWAYDLVRSDSKVILDAGDCGALLGLDLSDVASLDGDVAAYGFDPSYVGHEEVLMVLLDTTWAPVSQASWDEATGSFSYAWIDSVVTR
jgi:hypothetical protein